MESTVTEPATARRPSPRPRPADEPPHLRIVPAQTEIPETCNLQSSPGAPSGEDPQVSGLSGRADAETATAPRARIAQFWASAVAYWTPPAIFTEPPASLAELRSYATTAPWIAQ